jgi:hypothetical protein
MWLFTRYGFFSIAEADNGGSKLMVRARAKKHLEALQTRFPELAKLTILRRLNRDYKWRLIVPRAIWMSVVSEMTAEQTWSNVKDEVWRFNKDAIYSNAMHSVWQLMFAAGCEWDGEKEEG